MIMVVYRAFVGISLLATLSVHASDSKQEPKLPVDDRRPEVLRTTLHRSPKTTFIHLPSPTASPTTAGNQRRLIRVLYPKPDAKDERYMPDRVWSPRARTFLAQTAQAVDSGEPAEVLAAASAEKILQEMIVQRLQGKECVVLVAK
jgi:hypothetical protein